MSFLPAVRREIQSRQPNDPVRVTLEYLLQRAVGRHNAMDKLVGGMLKKSLIPVRDYMLLFSGRLSFELVQKARMVGAPLLCAIGAPSSLAVELAEECGMTLVGFLNKDRFNIYTGRERIT